MSQFRIADWFSDISPDAINSLRTYHEELLKWTKSINLISPQSVENSDRIHLADAISAVRAISTESFPQRDFWDLGSGNGIPGVVMAILCPGTNFVCLDSDQRKVGFIRQVTIKLGLKNIRTVCGRIEDLTKNSIEFAIVRGLAPINEVCGFVENVVRPDGKVFHMKSANWKKELGEGCSTWNVTELATYVLPIENECRAIILTTKK